MDISVVKHRKETSQVLPLKEALDQVGDDGEKRRSSINCKRVPSMSLMKKIALLVLLGIVVMSVRRRKPLGGVKEKTTEHHITTGTEIYSGSPGCQDTDRCVQYFPTVDLHEFQTENSGKKFNDIVNNEDFTKNKNLAVLTKRGVGTNHEKGNQDRAFIISPFIAIDSSTDDSSRDFLMCVMDGHGENGHFVSGFAALKLPNLFTKYLGRSVSSQKEITGTAVRNAMTRTFQELDEHVSYFAFSGTTATVTYRIGGQLHVANVGDSCTMVVAFDKAQGTTKIIYKSRADTPTVPEEKERITKMGGTVWQPPPSMGGGSRVFVQFQNGTELLSLALAVTRSIGDNLASKKGVIADPIVDTIELDSHWNNENVELFVLAATDGLERIKYESLLPTVAASLYQDTGVSPLVTLENMIEGASEGWKQMRIPDGSGGTMEYRDDITIAVAKVLR